MAWVDERPDATLAELRARARAELGVAVSVGCVWATLRRMRLTLKKSR
jgi:transposase